MTYGEKAASGGSVARSHAGERWYSRVAREWLVIVLTAIAVAFFTGAGQYIATIRVENEKVRSGNIVKIADDFQTRFSSLMTTLQRFTSAAVKDKKIPDQERAELASAVLAMQLMMSPATGRWPHDVLTPVNLFFKDLAEFDVIVRNAGSFSDLESLENKVRGLVVDDMQVMRAMQKEAQIHYSPF
jgi:hypothetical protein